MAEPSRMIGGRQSAGSGVDNQHPLVAGRRVDRELPVSDRGKIAEKPLDGMDADGPVECRTVAGAFARVIADAAVNGRQRVVPHQGLPGGAEPARLGECEPGLDVLAGRAGVVVRRQQLDIDRPAGPDRPRALSEAGIEEWRDVAALLLHDFPSTRSDCAVPISTINDRRAAARSP
jgi:hypothetical protein